MRWTALETRWRRGGAEVIDLTREGFQRVLFIKEKPPILRVRDIPFHDRRGLVTDKLSFGTLAFDKEPM